MNTAEQNNTQLTGKIEFGGKKYRDYNELMGELFELHAEMKKSLRKESLTLFSDEEILEECKVRGLL